MEGGICQYEKLQPIADDIIIETTITNTEMNRVGK